VSADLSGTVMGAFALALLLLLGACAARIERPALVDDQSLRGRAVTRTDSGIQVSAAVPTVDESRSIFGVDLDQHGIQPLWLEIENHSGRGIYFLKTGVDPEYFAPLEVASLYHGVFDDRGNAALDEHFEALSFDSHRTILPGETVKGFVYANRTYPSMMVDIDLIGHQWSDRIGLLVPVPGNEAAQRLQAVVRQYGEADSVREIDDEATLRAALAALPCCATDQTGTSSPPLNLVVIGELDEFGPAFARRNYRYAPAAPWHAFGRIQDFSAHKISRWVEPRPLTLRLWLAPLRYQGRPVWALQASTNLGGRFAPSTEGMGRIDPNVDESRNDILQDLFYSQALVKVGFVKGAGSGSAAEFQRSRDDWHYQTDGLRAVLVFGGKSVSLGEVQFFDWERPVH
jgi:hypothetical protein